MKNQIRIMGAGRLVQLFLSFALILLVGRIGAKIEPKSVTFPSYRLNRNVVPYHYIVDLDHNFHGQVKIKVLIEKLETRKEKISTPIRPLPGWKNQKPLSELVEKKEDNYAENLILIHVDKSVTVDDIIYEQNMGDKNPPLKYAIDHYQFDEAKQLLAIVFDKNLETRSKGILTIKFRPEVRKDLRGLHRVDCINIYDRSDQNCHTYLTKFQPSDARLLFPCFDEPGFKARFDLKIFHDDELMALSNTKIKSESRRRRGYPDKVEHEFRTTEKMSIHMFAFALGKFTFMENKEGGHRKVRVRVYATTGLHTKLEIALGVATKAIKWMEDYTYHKFPLEKFDILCVLNHHKDSTENWGLSTLRSRYCLYDSGSHQSTKVLIALNVAHVVAHQWYANLVTAKWWDSLWITEGAATFLAFELVRELYAQHNSDYIVQFSALSDSIVTDNKILPTDMTQIVGSKPHTLNKVWGELYVSEDVDDLFDSLESIKSGSLFKLIEKKFGEENFERVMRELINQYRFRSVDENGFLSVLSREIHGELDLSLLKSQIDSFRAPELKVSLYESGEGFQLKCEQITTMSSASYLTANLHFYEISINEELRHESRPVDMRSAVIRYPEWFDFANENHYLMIDSRPDFSQYYLINIDKSLDRNFERAINNKNIPVKGKAALLEHAIRRYRIIGPGYIQDLEKWLSFYTHVNEMPIVLRIVEAMKLLAAQNRDSRVVRSLYAQIEDIFSSYGDFFPINSQRGTYKSYGNGIVGALSQTGALTLLVEAGKENVYTQALKFFDITRGQIESVHLREPVYKAVIRYGTQEQKLQLVKNLVITESQEERERLIVALASYEGPKIDNAQLVELCSSVNKVLPIDMLKAAQDMCKAVLDRKRDHPDEDEDYRDPPKIRRLD